MPQAPKNKSRLHKPYYRNGENHRSGADVSFKDIQIMFGFKTIEIGKWVKPEEQQLAANLFFDALCDLADILNVPEPVISLNGSLSLAFGKGGQKYASAHYNAAKRQLALAKNAGGGALAHEWFHAFDHYITPRLFQQAAPGDFASALWLQNHQVIEHPLNQYLEDCYQHIFLKPNSDEMSDLFVKSAAADKAMNTFYFAQPQEISARAFEACIQEHAIKNAFLVQGTKQSTEAKIGVYPVPAHRKLIANYFRRYFSALGYALKKRSN